jgi:hypothetical protein
MGNDQYPRQDANYPAKTREKRAVGRPCGALSGALSDDSMFDELVAIWRKLDADGKRRALEALRRIGMLP